MSETQDNTRCMAADAIQCESAHGHVCHVSGLLLPPLLLQIKSRLLEAAAESTKKEKVADRQTSRQKQPRNQWPSSSSCSSRSSSSSSIRSSSSSSSRCSSSSCSINSSSRSCLGSVGQVAVRTCFVYHVAVLVARHDAPGNTRGVTGVRAATHGW